MRRLTPLIALLAALPVSTPPAAADEHTVTFRCEWVLKTVPTGDMLLVLVGEAHATGPTPAVTTTVYCRATTVYRERLEVSNASLGPDAYAAGGRYLRYDPPATCGTATAMFLTESLDDVEVVTEDTCGP